MIIAISFLISPYKLCCVYSLEAPHRGYPPHYDFNPCPAEYIMMPCPLLIFSQSDYLIWIVHINSDT